MDGVTTDVASTLEGERRGEERLLYSFGDLVKDFHMQVFFATNKLIASRPAAVRAFLAGWFETVAFARANKAAHDRDRAARSWVFIPTCWTKVYDRVVGHLSTDGRFNPRALAVLARSYVELKLLDKEPDMSKLYTDAFLPIRSSNLRPAHVVRPDPNSSQQPLVSNKQLALIVYILYLAAYLTGLTAVIGVIIAHIKIGDADELTRSHYQFQIRTFWIGLLYRRHRGGPDVRLHRHRRLVLVRSSGRWCATSRACSASTTTSRSRNPHIVDVR